MASGSDRANHVVDRMAERATISVFVLGILCLLGTVCLLTFDATDKITAAQIVGFGVGASLIATALATYVQTSSERRIRGSRLGLRRVFQRRVEVTTDVYRDYVEKAQRRIWVQGVQLRRFLQNNREALENAAARGVDVRLLVISSQPHISLREDLVVSPLVMRSLEEQSVRSLPGTQPDAIEHSELLEFRDEVKRTLGARQERTGIVEIREYLSTCGNMVFLIDNELFFGPYLHCSDSGETPTFQVGPGLLLQSVERHFNILWDDRRFCTDLPG